MSTGRQKKVRKAAVSFFLVFVILEGLLIANMVFGVWSSPAVADESRIMLILQNTAISIIGAVGAAIGAWTSEAPTK